MIYIIIILVTQLMDWGKSAPSAKVQNYLNIFNDFIKENHSASNEED